MEGSRASMRARRGLKLALATAALTLGLSGVALAGSTNLNNNVVTFNGDQQRLIENQARRSAPSLEANFDLNQTNEPILGARASSRSMRGSVSCR